jgi:predicted polyphosphate/ATP-dependent NAD kinase
MYWLYAQCQAGSIFFNLNWRAIIGAIFHEVYSHMKRIGLIVNPIAGMGGRVGLKGSDGKETLELAKKLGAVPECPGKALTALKQIKDNFKGNIEMITYPAIMGEQEARDAGFKPKVIGKIIPEDTSAEDTIQAAKDMRDADVDLIFFAGGDGTARNIFDALGEQKFPVLGIPGGCKIHSAVYAINPKTAGNLVVQYLEGKVKDLKISEVMDIDEDAFREGMVTAKLYGYLHVPNEKRMVQNMKSGRGYSEEAALDQLARYFSDHMAPDTLYVVGTGSTTKKILEKLGEDGTLLGVDLVYGNKIVAKDVNEKGILDYLAAANGKVKMIVTVIGGQGYVFGRGNQQLSPAVIRKVGLDNIIIAASKPKMLSLFGKPLLVDTGDEELNKELSGYRRVYVGYGDSVMFKLTSDPFGDLD